LRPQRRNQDRRAYCRNGQPAPHTNDYTAAGLPGLSNICCFWTGAVSQYGGPKVIRHPERPSGREGSGVQLICNMFSSVKLHAGSFKA
jgi:hypothetical protein